MSVEMMQKVAEHAGEGKQILERMNECKTLKLSETLKNDLKQYLDSMYEILGI